MIWENRFNHQIMSRTGLVKPYLLTAIDGDIVFILVTIFSTIL